MNFSGEFIAPRRPDEVFQLLANPQQFASLLPDFQSMTVGDAAHFTLRLNIGLGNIRGTAEIKMELTEALPPTRVRYQGQGLAIGSQLDFGFVFDLAPLQESTRVSWQTQIGISGKLAFMAGGMLEPLARGNTQKLMDGLRTALAVPAPPLPGEVAPEQAAPQEQPIPPATSAAASPSAEVISPTVETDKIDDVNL